MGIEFIIEETLDLNDRGAFVFARPKSGQSDFRVVLGSTLGGLPVKPYVDMPRRLLPDGTPDLGCFQFQLVERENISRIEKGAIVSLEPDG